MSKISPSNSLDITSSDPNENTPIINSLSESDSCTKTSENQNRSNDLKQQNLLDFKNIISVKPILAREILEEIQSDVQKDTIASDGQALNSKQNLQIKSTETEKNQTVEKPIEILKVNSEIVQHSAFTQLNSTTSLEQTTNMDIVSKGVSNIGESLMNDIKTIASTGEEKLNDLAKETEKTLKEVPKNVIDYVKTSVGIENEEKEEKDTILDANLNDVKEDASKDLQKQMTDSKLSSEMSNISPIQNIDSNEPHESEKIEQNNKLNRALTENDMNLVADIDETKNNIDIGIKFVNDGVDVSSSSSIIQAMKDEINEMSNDVRGKSDELTMKYDDIISNELTTAKEGVSSRIFEMKNGEVQKQN